MLEVTEDVKFVMAGSGDMMTRTIEMAAEMGIGHKVLFTGFETDNFQAQEHLPLTLPSRCQTLELANILDTIQDPLVSTEK